MSAELSSLVHVPHEEEEQKLTLLDLAHLYHLFSEIDVLLYNHVQRLISLEICLLRKERGRLLVPLPCFLGTRWKRLSMLAFISEFLRQNSLLSH